MLKCAGVDPHAAKSARARRIASERGRCSVKYCDLLGSEAHGNDLHRLSTATGAAAPATLQFLDVIASFGLVCPLLDLLVSDHEQIKYRKQPMR